MGLETAEGPGRRLLKPRRERRQGEVRSRGKLAVGTRAWAGGHTPNKQVEGASAETEDRKTGRKSQNTHRPQDTRRAASLPNLPVSSQEQAKLCSQTLKVVVDTIRAGKLCRPSMETVFQQPPISMAGRDLLYAMHYSNIYICTVNTLMCCRVTCRETIM